MSIIQKLAGGGLEIEFLESGVDLEQQLRQLNPRKRRKWYMRKSRKNWLIIGVVLGGGGGCLVGLVVLSKVVLPALAAGV